MGLLQVGQGAGIALGPIIGGAVADRFGYAAAFYVTAVLLLLGGLLVLIGVKEPFEKRPLQAKGRAAGVLRAWRDIFALPGVPVTFVLQFLSQLGTNLLTPVLPLFIPTVIGASQDLNTFTGLVVGATAATSTVSSIYFGRLGDRVGHRVILIGSLVVGGLFYIPEVIVNTGWQILALQALVGVAAGGIVPSISALQARFTHRGMEGAVYGLDNSIGSGARSLAPMIGAGIAVSWSLRAAFPITGGIMILAAFTTWLLLPKRTDPQVTKIIPVQAAKADNSISRV